MLLFVELKKGVRRDRVPRFVKGKIVDEYKSAGTRVLVYECEGYDESGLRQLANTRISYLHSIVVKSDVFNNTSISILMDELQQVCSGVNLVRSHTKVDEVHLIARMMFDNALQYTRGKLHIDNLKNRYDFIKRDYIHVY